jgi:hypothetical protein
MTRKEANMDIIRLLVNYINSNPDQRFGQILISLNVSQERDFENSSFNAINFYEEPQEMIERIIETMKGK